MPYTLVSDSTTAAAKIVYVADNGLTNIVGGGAITQTGTMPSSMVSGHAALGLGAASDNYLSVAMGANVGAGVPYAVLIVGEFGNSEDKLKGVISYPGSSVIKPQIFGADRPPKKVSCSSQYVGAVDVGAIPGNTWLSTGEQIIICGRNAANKMGGSLNGAASVISNYTDGSLSGGTLSASDVIRFGGSPVTNSGNVGLAGFAVSMFAVFVGITPEALNAYIGTNPWAMVTTGGGNAAPTFPGPNIGNQTGTVGTALSSNTISDSFSDSDALTFTAVGSWPAGVTVSSAGVISGTPTTAGTYASLSVRATDTAAQTVDSDTFSFTISAASVNAQITATTADTTFSGAAVGYVASSSAQVTATTADATFSGSAFVAAASGSFVTEPMVNNTGTLQASVAVLYEWRVGTGIGVAPTSVNYGTGTTDASGVLTATGLTSGAGVLLVATTDRASVYYQAGTVA